MNPEDKMTGFPVRLNAVVLDCGDINVLSDFYIRFLGWKQGYHVEDQWMEITEPGCTVKIAFQKNEDYVPPVWPEESEKQQQMEHLDFAVENREQMALAVEHAISCGAVKAKMQYSEDWTVLMDPSGHPFCIVC